jgi:predicted alpha/beta superfamily hydrolase
MKKFLSLIFLGLSTTLYAQRIDTLTFFSEAFQKERTVYVHLPEFYKYSSDSVQWPVIYLLDGQHEWLVNPVLSSIRYLQYTHEMPQAVVVVVPLENRNEECAIRSIEGASLPLLTFLTTELNERIKIYRPLDHRLLIGHSFSASFALYARLRSPDFFSSVIAHTPLDELESLIQGLERQNNLSGICISTGGIAKDKDYYHRKEYDALKQKYPEFFTSVRTYEADYSAHNAVPIVGTPIFLTALFAEWCSRYSAIAEVDEEYQLKRKPVSVAEEMRRIKEASLLDGHFYAPEIPDVNGIASRYLASNLGDYGSAVYEWGLRYFPHYFEFHWGLYDVYVDKEPSKAKYHLQKALECVKRYEADAADQQDLLFELQKEWNSKGW